MSTAYLEVLQSYVSDLDEYEQHSKIQRFIQERRTSKCCRNNDIVDPNGTSPHPSRAALSSQSTRVPPSAESATMPKKSTSVGTSHSFMTSRKKAPQIEAVTESIPEPLISRSIHVSTPATTGVYVNTPDIQPDLSSAASADAMPAEDYLRVLEITQPLWHLPGTAREEATELLALADVGSFIVRLSSSRGDACWALTLREQHSCLHFSLQYRKSLFSLSTSSFTFPSLIHLVAFYSRPNTDMSHALRLPEFLLHCVPQQLHQLAAMKSDFWRRYSHIRQRIQDGVGTMRPDALDGERRSKSLTDLLSQRPPPPLPPPPVEEVSPSQDYDFLWRQAHSIQDGSTNSKRTEGVYANGTVVSVFQAPVYDNCPQGNTGDSELDMESAIYCSPWDQTSSLSKALSQLKSVVASPQPAAAAEGPEVMMSSLPRPATFLYDISSQNSNCEDTLASSADEEFHNHVMPFVHTKLPSPAVANKKIGQNIRKFILDLASNKSCMFAQKISIFVTCTLDSKKTDPRLVMRNVRQFLHGLRNLLLTSEKNKLSEAIAKERPKLRSGEFLNVETIVECVLSRILIKPLKEHIYRLIYNDHERTNSTRVFMKAMDKAARMSPAELGIRDSLEPPNAAQLQGIQQCFDRMVDTYSPLRKLEYLLKAVQIIYSAISASSASSSHSSNTAPVGADDFLPVFVFCVSRCRLYAAELEAEFMHGLLAPNILNGEAGYYLTTLQASVEVIKALEESGVETSTVMMDESRVSMNSMSSRQSHCQRGVVRVIILDEVNDNIISKVFPLRPWSTVRELCNMISHRLNIFNPLDYSLYHYMNGEEKLLSPGEHPMQIKDSFESRTEKTCIFLYKRTHSYTVLPADFETHVL